MLVKWGGYMKMFVLMCIFLNVLVTPWGVAGEQTPAAVLLAVPLVLFKMLCLLLVLVLGVYVPGLLHDLLSLAASALTK